MITTKQKIKYFGYSLLITACLVGVALYVSHEPPLFGGLTEEEKEWKGFTDNLENINYKHEGKLVKEIKDEKGIWQPTQEDFIEIYKYVYGEDLVVWQKLDGTEMCPIQAKGRGRSPCVPHWQQELNNTKERGKENIIQGLMEGVIENEVDADLLYSIQPISKKKFDFKKWISKLFQSVFAAAIEFEDHFTVDSDIDLKDHTPDTTGTGWSVIIDLTISRHIRVNSLLNLIDPSGAEANGGLLYEGDDTMSGANYTVSILQVNGDTLDDTDIMCCRIQSANDMYCLEWNEAASDLYERVGGGWSPIDTNGGGIADTSIVELICEGTSISVEDDNSEILSATNSSHSSAGKAGIGLGAVITFGDDFSAQKLDDFMVTVEEALPEEEPTKKQSEFWF